jgi:protein-L-isoaspartate(D-aspartate) O-methyltransferase
MGGDTSSAAGDVLRAALVDQLVADGRVQTSAVEDALRRVPREAFVPDLDLTRVYEDRPQLVKADAHRTLSTISQPTMVAIMLELAELSPGDRVLEIGSGTGYNAALLATLVGPGGEVVGVDIEEDLVRSSRAALASLGLRNVAVHVGDGRDGWPDDAPYDCVMATVGAEEVPLAWRYQVIDGGRLLVPMLRENTLVVERRAGDDWEPVATSPAAFIPLR